MMLRSDIQSLHYQQPSSPTIMNHPHQQHTAVTYNPLQIDSSINAEGGSFHSSTIVGADHQNIQGGELTVLGGCGTSSNSSTIIVAGLQPTKPTHRRKKSQQPTLMTTKQKQVTYVPPTNRNAQSLGMNTIETAQSQEARFELQSAVETKNPVSMVKPNEISHQHAMSYVPYTLTGQLTFTIGDNNSGSKRTAANSNLKEGASSLHGHSATTSGDPTSSILNDKSRVSFPVPDIIRQSQPLSPKVQGFNALSHIRERVHSIGFVDLTTGEFSQRQGAKINSNSNQQINGHQQVPTSHQGQDNNLNSSDKKNKVKKQISNQPQVAAAHTRPEHHRTQYAVQISINNRATSHTGATNNNGSAQQHKRNQTKGFYPVGSGLLVPQKFNLPQNSETARQSDQQLRISGSHNERLRYPEALAHVNQKNPIILSNKMGASQSHATIPIESGTESNQNMIKQLMKKHFVAPNSTKAPHQNASNAEKAAYLKHVGAKQQVMGGGNHQPSASQTVPLTVQRSLQFSQGQIKEETPSPSMITISGKLSIANPSKRVTFDAPSSHAESEDERKQSYTHEEDDNDYPFQQYDHQPSPYAKNRTESHHRRSQYFIDPTQQNQNVQEEYSQEEDSIHHHEALESYNQDSQYSVEHLESMQQEPTVVIDSSIEDNVAVDYRKLDDQEPSQEYGTSHILGANTSGTLIERPQPSSL